MQCVREAVLVCRLRSLKSFCQPLGWRRLRLAHHSLWAPQRCAPWRVDLDASSRSLWSDSLSWNLANTWARLCREKDSGAKSASFFSKALRNGLDASIGARKYLSNSRNWVLLLTATSIAHQKTPADTAREDWLLCSHLPSTTIAINSLVYCSLSAISHRVSTVKS